MKPLTLEWVQKAEGYAIRFRYPGDIADKYEAKQALRAARAVRDFIIRQLGD